ncbi:MAG: Polysaccharide biosynthesis protein [Thermotogales bacterium 46_20]|nr:MAG: Polysaccharide biosynthesis protein [Thermotogales bacterium 46_20]
MSSVVGDISKVFGSNLLVLTVGIVNGFLIPGFLGIEEYALFKTFGLYASYVGILHFGFVDGIYIKYGGIKREQVPDAQLKAELLFLFGFQLLLLLFGVVVSFALNMHILIPVSLSILPVNMITFFKFLYQATGSFGQYARINSLTPVFTLIATLTIVFLIGDRNAALFISAVVGIHYLVFALLMLDRARSVFRSKGQPVVSKPMFDNIKVGIFIMIGNLSTMLFYSMDRWFVKILLRTEDFAFYSFSTSMMGMVMILVTSVAMTFYPMLVRRQEEETLLRTIKAYLLILGSFAATAYFAFDFVINRILEDYVPSLQVISILFAGFPAIAVINAIYVNMYKAQKAEKKYFCTVLGMAVFSFGFNALAVMIIKSNWAIAAATTIAFYLWFFYSAKDFKGTRTNLREISYLSVFLIVFFSTTRLFPWWLGLPLYLAGVLGITLLLYRKEFTELLNKVLLAFEEKW